MHRDPSEREAGEDLEREDPDPQHAGPAEATDDPGDSRPVRDVEADPGELPAELPDPDES